MKGTGVRLRALRAVVFTALCMTLSAGGHVLLSRMPLPLSTVSALSAGYFTVAWALAGRERGFAAIAALLVPLELAADTVFTTGQNACYGQAGGPVAGPLHTLGIDLVCGGGPLGTPLTSPASPGAAPWLLLAAHVAVGLAAAAWLRRGEVAVSRMLRAVVAVAFRPLLLAVLTLCPAGRPARVPLRPVRDTLPAAALPLLVHSVVRRGPPSVCPAHV
ncbi:hypothetical protein AB0A70_28480 [Streptomyces morookaense]|uniref:hypothetical protein n=1 Tax=Streptomyces morookaense TaxID=1970 RepID=UPI0034031276